MRIVPANVMAASVEYAIYDHAAIKELTNFPMLSITWEKIMDLIGGIKYIQDRLGERNHHHGKDKPAPKNTRNDAVNKGNTQTDASHSAAEHDTSLGRMVDTTA